jgi:hypothetical protein
MFSFAVVFGLWIVLLTVNDGSVLVLFFFNFEKKCPNSYTNLGGIKGGLF